jgi:hypothetical protein
MDNTYEVENIKEAVRVTSCTLVAYLSDSFPMSAGNCFSVMTNDGKEYSVVNFGHENLEELLRKKAVEWPIDIIPIDDHRCVIADHRIPQAWYSSKFCETCTPQHLLPPQQKLQRVLDLKSGRRIERKTIIDGNEFVSSQYNVDMPAGLVFIPNMSPIDTTIDSSVFDPSDDVKSKYEGREINPKFYGRIYPDGGDKKDEQSEDSDGQQS